MTPTDKVLKEFDEMFGGICTGDISDGQGGIEKMTVLRDEPEWKDIKSFLTRALTQAYRRGVEEAIECIPSGDSNQFNHEYTTGWNDCVGVLRKSIARLTETPL